MRLSRFAVRLDGCCKLIAKLFCTTKRNAVTERFVEVVQIGVVRENIFGAVHKKNAQFYFIN